MKILCVNEVLKFHLLYCYIRITPHSSECSIYDKIKRSLRIITRRMNLGKSNTVQTILVNCITSVPKNLRNYRYYKMVGMVFCVFAIHQFCAVIQYMQLTSSLYSFSTYGKSKLLEHTAIIPDQWACQSSTDKRPTHREAYMIIVVWCFCLVHRFLEWPCTSVILKHTIHGHIKAIFTTIDSIHATSRYFGQTIRALHSNFEATVWFLDIVQLYSNIIWRVNISLSFLSSYTPSQCCHLAAPTKRPTGVCSVTEHINRCLQGFSKVSSPWTCSALNY